MLVPEENTSNSQYYLKCTNLTISQLNGMNLSRGITAVFCVVILSIMLVVLCISKAYANTILRLLLYLIVATLINELCLIGTLEHQFYYAYQPQICAAVGFMTHWSSIVTILCAFGVILYAVLLVCTFLSVKCNNFSTIILSTRQKRLLEVMYLLSVTFLPLTVIWVALVYEYYGLAVAWCWIRAINEDCKTVGLKEQLILGYGACEAVGIVGIISMIGLTVTYCKLSSSFVQVKKLLLQSLSLTFCVLLYTLVTNSALVIRIYSGVTKWTQHYSMWIYHGVMFPLCQMIIPVGFMGSFYFKNIRNLACFKKKC